MTDPNPISPPPAFKRSRTKLWIRTIILAVFGTLFGLALYHDISSGVFRWTWAVVVFVVFLPIGYWMRNLVPMESYPETHHVTLSFDRIYFGLIVLLVIVKAVASHVHGLAVVADVVMCVILGLMIGRLSGICLRVHGLRQRHV